MSELKVFTFGLGRYTEDGYPCVVAVDGEGNPRLASDEEFYLKSEADKVIADLEESHKKEVEQLLMEIMKLKHSLELASNECCSISERGVKNARHHKYKRCLAMAKICEDKLGTVVKPGWWNKWHKRWLELAEKFKEA